jgi:hypothetical protein
MNNKENQMAEEENREAETTPAAKANRKRSKRRKKAASRAAKRGAAKKVRGPSTPFPPVPFLSVLSLAEAIQRHGAGQPTRRITIFDKLDKSPESSASRLLITNSGRYGVTKGSYKADVLELTPLGAVATSPDSPARERAAARFKLAIEAVPAFKFLYEKNVGKRVPSPEVLQDSLEEIKILPEHRKQCVDLFLENLKDLGLLRMVAGAERIISIDQLLEEAPSAAGTPTTVAAAIEAGIQKVDKSKKSWKTTCFVIAPIDAEGSEQRKHSDMVLESLLRRAIEGEWEVIRSDQITSPGMISGQVIEHLLNSGLVVADLSFHNPNVFYELALRHAVGKPTVHLIRAGDSIPFDLKDFRTITIDTLDKYELVAKLDTYRAEIANHVRQAVAEGAESSNPVRTFGKGFKVVVE